MQKSVRHARAYTLTKFLNCGTDLDDSFHHAHHLVDDGDDFVRPFRWRHVRPVGRRQDVSTGHVQNVSGGQFEVHCGAVGVVDDG